MAATTLTSIAASPVERRMGLAADLSAAALLAVREWKRFLRQRNRIIGAVGQPVIFWLLFGAGLTPTFRLSEGGPGFSEYFLPGVVFLILLFTAIFATISIIEDRHEGFLQAVLAAPRPAWVFVAGKVAGAGLLAVAQAILFYALGAWWLGLPPTPAAAAAILLLLVASAVALTSLGFVLAWRIDSTQGFHAVMSVLLFPMWLVSGAFFPASGGLLGAVIAANPMSYGVAGLRRLMYWGASPELQAAATGTGVPSLAVCCAATAAFAVVMFVAAVLVSRQGAAGDLRT